ncbi:MAG: hypothetical protein J6T35_08715 [Bacteroidales bacterium]|nr:hypothetical protein [Bacteroidales bacterium]
MKHYSQSRYFPPLVREIPTEPCLPLCISGLKDLKPHSVYEEGNDF